ncbi:hypothetical protein D3G77_22890, partial [Escherichia coli]|nr:hypothetical protein [Escherichia coli]
YMKLQEGKNITGGGNKSGQKNDCGIFFFRQKIIVVLYTSAASPDGFTWLKLTTTRVRMV